MRIIIRITFLLMLMVSTHIHSQGLLVDGVDYQVKGVQKDSLGRYDTGMAVINFRGMVHCIGFLMPDTQKWGIVSMTTMSTIDEVISHTTLFYGVNSFGKVCIMGTTSLIMQISEPDFNIQIIGNIRPPVYACSLKNQIVETDEIIIYPNPTSDCFTIDLKNIKKLELFDLNGISLGTFFQQQTICLAELNIAAGTYILKIDSNESIYYKKIEYVISQ